MISKIYNILAAAAILILTAGAASAQTGPDDGEYTANSDSLFEQLIENSRSCISNQPFGALEYAAQAKMMAEQANDSLRMAQSYRMLADCYYHTRIYYLAMEMYFKAYEIFSATKQEDMVAECLVGVAKTYYAQEVFELAEEYCMKAIDVCKVYNCDEAMADALATLGQVSIVTNEDVAIPNMKEAKRIYDSLDIVDKSININISLARAYTQLDMADTALNILESILEKYVINGSQSNIARTYLALGDTYYSINDKGKAGIYYKNALKKFYESNLIHDALVCRNRMARMQYRNADYQQALDNALTVLKEAQLEEVQHGTEEIMIKHRACYIIYNIYKNSGNNELALKYCEQFAETGDSIYLLKKQEQFSEFQISMESQQKQKEIEMIQKNTENDMLKLEKKAYTRNTISLIVIVILVIVVVIVYYRRYKEKERNNTTLAFTNQRMEQEIQERKIAENELRNSEEKYRLLFRKTPMGIIQFNDKYIITAINERLSEIMGLKNKKVAGQDVFSIIPQKAMEGYSIQNDTTDENSKMFKKEAKVNTPNGEVYLSLSIKSYLYNSGTDVEKGGIMIVEDITERKKASEHELIYNAASNNIINILPESVYLLDNKGNYIFARIPHLPVSEQNAYIGKNMRQMLRPDVLLPFLVAFNTVRKTGEEQFAEYQEEDTPDCKQTNEARFVATDDDKVLVIVRDISRQKNQENKLKSAKNTAESGSKAKSEFILGMTTEIKQPLENILKNCEQLVASSPDNEQSAKLKEVLNTALFVNETFTDVLKLTEVEAGKKALSTRLVNPVTLASDVFEIFRSRANEKKLSYEFHTEGNIPQQLQLDEVRVRQILFNIISNGIKYTEKGGVKLSISCTEPENGKGSLAFTVADTGVGLSEMQTANLFTGNGKSGLILAKKMADNLKGSLSVKSEVGKGSEFTFALPIARADHEIIKKESPASTAHAHTGEKTSRKKNTDSMREYISVLKYAVVPEFNNMKNDMSFASLTEFINKFKEQSQHYHIDKGTEIADELLSNIQNYDISNITMNIRKLETYIHNSIQELQGE
ncbi:MAG: PAS domain S-box protein [Bacteroidales bacterium]|nr:PAS domain S-box protein [Bacteroidales bacterium]